MIFRYKIKFISDIEQKIRKLLVNIAVTPFVGVWIEISMDDYRGYNMCVTPFVGVWIEISYWAESQARKGVTPFVGVWIEILYANVLPSTHTVTPFVGVWIEIGIMITKNRKGEWSLPSWECGLKYVFIKYYIITVCHSLRGSVD